MIMKNKHRIPHEIGHRSETDGLGHKSSVRDHQDFYHHKPKTISDKVAWFMVHAAARGADMLFLKRFGHRAIVLETVAAIPGMVGGLLQHMKCLRYIIRDDHGWIKTLIDEAENERIHLVVYSHVASPTIFEHVLIAVVQIVIFVLYFLTYLISPRTAHRFVGYLEEEAVHSYTRYLEEIDTHPHLNVLAPEVAIKYWDLPANARLREVVIATRADEMVHRDVNHSFADKLVENA